MSWITDTTIGDIDVIYTIVTPNDMDYKKKEIVEAINREKMSEKPNFDTIRMLQQQLDNLEVDEDKDR
jgi:predicted lipid-binding transport protein (Tim44 family)